MMETNLANKNRLVTQKQKSVKPGYWLCNRGLCGLILITSHVAGGGELSTHRSQHALPQLIRGIAKQMWRISYCNVCPGLSPGIDILGRNSGRDRFTVHWKPLGQNLFFRRFLWGAQPLHPSWRQPCVCLTVLSLWGH